MIVDEKNFYSHAAALYRAYLARRATDSDAPDFLPSVPAGGASEPAKAPQDQSGGPSTSS